MDSKEQSYKTPSYTRRAIENYHNKLKAENLELFKQKINNSVKKHNAENKEEIKQYTREYYLKNIEKIKQHNKNAYEKRKLSKKDAIETLV